MTAIATLSDAALLAELRDALFDDIRVLSVRNSPDPYAGLIADEIKPTENRTRRTNYVGPILIHSSAYEAPKNAVRRVPEGVCDIPERLLLRGHVLALATITGCHRAHGCCAPWGEPDAWHWTLTGVRALPEPIPAKGRLGLWKPSREIAAEALRQLTGVRDAA